MTCPYCDCQTCICGFREAPDDAPLPQPEPMDYLRPPTPRVDVVLIVMAFLLGVGLTLTFQILTGWRP